MEFTSALIHGKLIKRYKRFLADVQLSTGEIVVAHCPNTGAMTGCAEPGFDVWLRFSDDPKRKLAYSWELVQNAHGHWIGINTHNANTLVNEALIEDKITALSGYSHIAREVKYGNEASRIDFLLKGEGLPDHYVEVKSVTLLEQHSGFFPDAKTARGAKHLRELSYMIEQGHEASLLFCVQHTGIQEVSIAKHIDPNYYSLLTQAIAVGVKVLVFGCVISEEKIVLNQQLPFKV
jgi:sugar fermentation stimulation protein A